MTKKSLAVLLFCFVAVAPSFAQKFTKREQARREAREKYYFCGNMFTLTAGYNHSWLTPSDVTLKSSQYGKSEKMTNTKDAFNIGFLWDHAFKKAHLWSIQSGLYFTVKGGEHLYYYDNGLGSGPQLKEEQTEKLTIQGLELQCLLRRIGDCIDPQIGGSARQSRFQTVLDIVAADAAAGHAHEHLFA